MNVTYARWIASLVRWDVKSSSTGGRVAARPGLIGRGRSGL